MDFHSLNRRDLQSLCKLNKIPANLTNVAMADALKYLHTVEGIEEFLNPSRSETVGSLVDSPEKVEVMSPRVPRTSCRTSTRQKVKKTEVESLPATASRTTSRGVRRQLGGEVNELVKIPLVTSTRKNVPTTASRQNVLTQLNECEEVEKNDCLQNSPAAVATCNRRKATIAATCQDTVKKETTVQGVYSTRRSTRLTAKKSAEPGVIEKGKSQPVKIGSFLEVSVTSEENLCNLAQEKTVDSGSGSIETFHESSLSSDNTEDNVEEGSFESCDKGVSKEKVEDICNAFEKLDVVVVDGSDQILSAEKPLHVDATLESGEEKEGCSSKLDDIKAKSVEMVDQHENIDDFDEKSGQVDNQKPVSDDISNPFEDVDSEEKMMVADEKVDLNETLNVSVKEQNVNLASEEHSEEISGQVDGLKQDTEDMSILCEDGDSEEKLLVVDQKVDLNEALNFSVKEPNGSLEHSNKNLLAEADGIDADVIFFDTENPSNPSKLTSEDMSAVSEMKNEVSECNGSTNLVDLVHFNTEISSELSKLDNIDNHNVAEEMTADNIEMEISSNTIDVVSVNPNELEPNMEFEAPKVAQDSLINETVVELNSEQLSQVTHESFSCITEENHYLANANDVIDHPTLSNSPTSIRGVTQVSDNNENRERKLQSVLVEEDKIINEEDGDGKPKSLNDTSIRQLKKRLKALSIKNNINVNKDDKVAEAGPALQAVCENQLTTGEMEN